MKLRSLFLQAAILLTQALSMPTFCSAEADAPKLVTEREVIEERRRTITIYELVTPDPTVLPRTIAVTRHTAAPTVGQFVEAINQHCLRKADGDQNAIQVCVKDQKIALHAVTNVEGDAGLQNIVQSCMSASKRLLASN